MESGYEGETQGIHSEYTMCCAHVALVVTLLEGLAFYVAYMPSFSSMLAAASGHLLHAYKIMQLTCFRYCNAFACHLCIVWSNVETTMQRKNCCRKLFYIVIITWTLCVTNTLFSRAMQLCPWRWDHLRGGTDSAQLSEGHDGPSKRKKCSTWRDDPTPPHC
jgi:hypothetical protein